MLEEVGLADRARDKFRTYSLGMKQRLAIAATLLKDPSLLIFDEPTNGLDPAGIHEIRATMRSLADRGKTVLVSSHILSEVQQVADTVSIIGRGRMLAEGTVAEILDAAGEQYARVGVADPARAAAICSSAAGFHGRRRPGASCTSASANGPLDLAQITRVLAEQGLYVSELVPVRRDLESVFLELTADEHLGTHPTAAQPAGPAGRAICHDPADRGGDQPAAEPPVHHHRAVIVVLLGLGAFQLAVNDAAPAAQRRGAGGQPSGSTRRPTGSGRANERTCAERRQPAGLPL